MASPSASVRGYAQDRVVINCDVCDVGKENEAEHFCRDCNQYLCVSCEKFHQKFHKDHKLVTPSQGRAIGYLDLTVICSKHNKTYSLYCRHCNSNICSQCLSEHTGHKLKNIDKHAKVLKTDLTEHVHKLEKCLSDLNSKSDMLKAHLLNFDKLIEKQISLVENETAKIRTALETQSAKLIQDFKKEKQMAHVTLSDQIKTVDDCKRDIESLTTSIKVQIDIAPDAGMLQFFNDSKTKLETKSSKKTFTLPNPSTFTPASLGDQLLVGSTHNTGSTVYTLNILCGASDTHVISKTPTTQSHTPVDPPPSLRRELSVLHELSLGDSVDSCTTDGSSCWVGVYTDFTSGKVQLVNKHGEQLLTVKLPHRVEHTALTSIGDLLVSGGGTTKITRVTRQGKTRAFVDIKARGVKCVSGLCTTQQDDVFVCVRMADDKTKDKVIKMSAQGEQILQVSQHLFTSNKLYGIHKISRDTFCVQDGWGDQGSRLVIIDAGGQLLRHINRTGELQRETWDITGDRHGHIIAGTDDDDDDDDGYIHVYSGEGACIHTYKLPGSWRILSLSVGEDDVMWVGTGLRGLIVAKYLE